ncbi:MAG: hypothetical protein WC775_02115 [Patescibacteria group bacterium]|jgi:hypothetical protein
MSTEGQNSGFPYYPHNLRISSARGLEYAVTVMTRELPRDLIDHVEVNQAAHDRLSPDQKEYTTVDWLVSHAWLSTERGDREGKNVLTPYGFGRVIPVEYGSYMANGLHYGVITQKGGLVAGAAYLASRYLDTNDTTYPYGLFSKGNADVETGTSNCALNYGLRSSLVLGTIILKTQALEKWIKTAWDVDPLSQDTLVRILRHFNSNKEVPSIIFRMNSQLARITDSNIDSGLSLGHVPEFYNHRRNAKLANQRIGFICWVHELMAQNNYDPRLVAALNKLAYSPLGTATEEDFKLFLTFYTQLITTEKEKLAKLFAERSGEPQCVRILNLNMRDKDTEPSYIRTDYEADPGDSDYPKSVYFGDMTSKRYLSNLHHVVACHWSTLKHFFSHLDRANMRIFNFLEAHDIHINEIFLHN